MLGTLILKQNHVLYQVAEVGHLLIALGRTARSLLFFHLFEDLELLGGFKIALLVKL